MDGGLYQQDAWRIEVPDYDKVKPFVDKVKDVYVKHSEKLEWCVCSTMIGKNDCNFCGNVKTLVYSLHCRITWHTYRDEYVSSASESHLIPMSKLKFAPGEIVYESSNEKVIEESYEPEISIVVLLKRFIWVIQSLTNFYF